MDLESEINFKQTTIIMGGGGVWFSLRHDFKNPTLTNLHNMIHDDVKCMLMCCDNEYLVQKQLRHEYDNKNIMISKLALT